jgi:hypothetical protein
LYEQIAKMTDSETPRISLANPIFTPVSAPELRSLGQDALRKFHGDRAVYLRRLEERKKEPGCSSLTPVSLATSIDPDILEGLIFTGQLPDECVTVLDVTDRHISAWLKEHLKNDSRFTTEDEIDTLVKNNLRMRVKERNVNLRVLSLFSDYNKLLKDHGLEWLLTKNPKECVQHIISAVRPVELQKRVSEDLAFSKQELQKDMKGLYKYLSEQAEHCEAFVPAISKPSPRVSITVSQGSAAGRGVTFDTGFQSNGATKGGQAGRKKSAGHNSPPATHEKSKDKPLCLNTTLCKERHFLKDCPVTSAADKDTLLAKYRADQVAAGTARQTRSTSKVGEFSAKRTGVSKPCRPSESNGPPDGRFMATFPCGYQIVCLPDNGSDDNILPGPSSTPTKKQAYSLRHENRIQLNYPSLYMSRDSRCNRPY